MPACMFTTKIKTESEVKPWGRWSCWRRARGEAGDWESRSISPPRSNDGTGLVANVIDRNVFGYDENLFNWHQIYTSQICLLNHPHQITKWWFYHNTLNCLNLKFCLSWLQQWFVNRKAFQKLSKVRSSAEKLRLQQYHQRGGQSWFWAKVLRWPGLGILVMVTPNNSFKLVTEVDYRLLWWMFWRRLAHWWVVDGALSWRQLLLQLVQPTNSKLSQPLPTRSMWRRYWCHSQTDSPPGPPLIC